jgi:eukaryotic-like serine/threonine-protein kinase
MARGSEMAVEQNIRKVQVFVSSPNDVEPERQRVELVAQRLNGLFSDRVRIETLLWEHKIFSAHDDFQGQIAPAANADLVVAIFWMRLGTPLPEKFGRMENGERYPSGTAYEVLTALDARRRGDRPDVYVFRKIEAFNDPLDEAKAQWEDLNAFFSRWFQAPDGQYLRAYQRFESADEFEDQVERLLRVWITEHVPRNKGVIWPIETEGSPFRGLLPFDARHAAVFFGRDRKVTRAIEQLQSVAQPESSIRSAPGNIPFLLIVGESGAGKSSLMRAGLAPRLTAPGVVPSVDVWRTAVARIGDDPDPFLTLAKALFVENDEKGGFGAALPELRHGDCPTPEQFVDLAARSGISRERGSTPVTAPVIAALTQIQAAEMASRQSKRDLCASLLLLVDQVENIFSGRIGDERRSAFARLLFGLAATRRVWIVATIRSDIYPRLITPGEFLALKDAGSTYDLAAPGESELSEIVRNSAKAAGLVYETNAATGERLDDRILRDAQGQNMLPLLQFALQRLFEKRVVVRTEAADREPHEEVRLTHEAYETMNGLDGAINETAKGALKKLGPADIRALPRLLRCLAVPVHDRNAATVSSGMTVRMMPRAEAVPDEPTARLVDALIDARIIVANDDLIGVAHQRVFESWEDARTIIADERDFFRIREEVSDQFRRWQENKRPRALLLAKGLPLAEAQQIVKRHGGELSPEVRAYIATSNRRAQLINIIVGGAAAVFAGLFVVSSALGLMTRSAQHAAAANYQAAKGALGDLISLITKGLRDTKGIEVATVQSVLLLVDNTIQKVQTVSGGDPELADLRAVMLYHGAKMFQKKQDTADALKDANASVAILAQITGYDKISASPAIFASARRPWRWQLSESVELVGDLMRETKKPQDARARFNEALAIVRRLVEEVPDTDEWAQGVSQIYTRLGDLDIYSDLDSAQANYESSMKIAARYYRRKPQVESWQRELAWPYAKLADVSVRRGDADKAPGHDDVRRNYYSVALDHLGNSLCLRREVAAHDPTKTEFTRDVSYTLDRIGAVDGRLKDSAAAETAYFESLAIRRALAASVNDNELYLGDVALSLQLIGDHYKTLGKAKVALAFYYAAVDARKKILALSPKDQQAQQKAAAAQKRADDLEAQFLAAHPEERLTGAWWLSIVNDAETTMTKLRTAAQVSATACLEKVNESVDQILGRMTTATIP